MSPNPDAATEDHDSEEPPRVLVVDDVEANLIAVEALLYDERCVVVCSRSGDEALRLLLKHDFAAVLLDVQMPQMDGYEVARHVRSNPTTRDVPILFLTAGRGDEDTALRAYGTGAVDFLLKPINATVLRSKVRVFLELSRRQAQIARAKRRLEATNATLHAAYAELKETQAQLLHAAKMASLGQLVAGVAHEINNPLAFSSSHLNTAQRSLERIADRCLEVLDAEGRTEWERAQNRLSEMGAGLERIRELVVKLRTFSRLDEGEPVEVCVADSLQMVLTIVRHRLDEAEIVVETRLEGPQVITCHPSLINQAAMNLVVNAIDAIGRSGQIIVSTEARGDDYLLSVEDTGGGIPNAIKERLFDPFFTTKPVGKGTGLGLSLAYAVVKKHGGTLTLANEGQGTKATISVPMANLAPPIHSP